MKVIIIGGGIRGLSAAWRARKKHPDARIIIAEKSSRLGGWLKTSREGGYFFEKGPRIFPFSKSPHLLELIEELGLEILHSDPKATTRYIAYKGRLRTPLSFWPFFVIPLIKEPFIHRGEKREESVHDFARRRFSQKIADLFFDPMTLGIYATCSKKVSLKGAFPTLYHMEKTYGSLVKGLLACPRQKRGLFTVKGGMDALIGALVKKIQPEVFFHSEAELLGERSVVFDGKKWDADIVFDAGERGGEKQSLYVVHLAYEGIRLEKKGLGFLVPSLENQSILGAVFDSCVFPQQNLRDEVRITAMLKPEEKEPLKQAVGSIQKLLKIDRPPAYSKVFFARDAIVQFPLGKTLPTWGVSVDAAIEQSKGIMEGERPAS